MLNGIWKLTLARQFIAMLLCGLLLMPAAHATEVTYLHTDALGSVVMESNESGQVTYNGDYRPFGEHLLDAPKDGPAFTGHVADVATGLTYMQQRYYDPVTGRFLSVDPVTAISDPVNYFNRYKYANNNPYKFTDPDGRGFREFVDKQLPLFRVAGDAIAADVAYVVGAATGNQALQDHAIEGMRENVTAQDGINAAMMMVSPRGAPGEGGAGLKGAAPDFVVTPGGTAVPTSQARMTSGLEAAGIQGTPLPGGKGTSYQLQNGVTVRAMQPSGQAPQRASFNNANGGPVTPDGVVPQPPRGATPQERRDFVRDRTHVEQTP